MPSVFLGMFFLVFFLVLGTILLHLVRGISQWSRNNNSPRLTVPATVVAKRSDVSHHHHQDANGIGHTSSSTTYYATFQVASGDRSRELTRIPEGYWVKSASKFAFTSSISLWGGKYGLTR